MNETELCDFHLLPNATKNVQRVLHENKKTTASQFQLVMDRGY